VRSSSDAPDLVESLYSNALRCAAEVSVVRDNAFRRLICPMNVVVWHD